MLYDNNIFFKGFYKFSLIVVVNMNMFKNYTYNGIYM